MRWNRDHQSQDVEDRRGAPGGRGGMRIGIGGAVLLLILSVLFKKNLFSSLGVMGSPGPSPGGQVAAPGNDELAAFAGFVFDDAQAFWQRELAGRHRKAKLVLFREETSSACGPANSAIGPFYCPGDEKVYIDLGFYQELKTRFGAPGDFAQAYVMAHEVGHHIQTVLGIEDRVRAEQRKSPAAKNALSVKMELQADCFAGNWAHSTARRDLLEKGDLEEGLAAASAVGDDRIQAAATGRIQPEKFTHGTAKERAAWFRRGFTSGKWTDCDTFAP